MSHDPHTTPEPHEHADDWHHHSTEEGVPQIEHAATVNSRTLMITFIGIVFGVVFLILLILVYFNNYVSTFKAQRAEGVPRLREEYVASRSSAETRLSSYGHIDRAAGVVHIPLEAATQRVIDEYAGQERADVGQEGDLANDG